MEFGNLVKMRRNAKSLTLSDLDNISGVSASFISRIENNSQKSPTITTVFKLATALDISLKEIEECFDTKLQEDTAENEIKLVKQTDYVLVKQGEEILSNIANNVDDYNNNINKLLEIAKKLKKERVLIVSSLQDIDFLINIRVNDTYLVNEMKELVENTVGGRIKVIEGYLKESKSDQVYEVEEFIDFLEDSENIGDYPVDEIRQYLRRINY
jgi:transcriptional regulator with XRE-family HTH domain